MKLSGKNKYDSIGLHTITEDNKIPLQRVLKTKRHSASNTKSLKQKKSSLMPSLQHKLVGYDGMPSLSDVVSQS
jgi:hypothetical protein